MVDKYCYFDGYLALSCCRFVAGVYVSYIQTYESVTKHQWIAYLYAAQQMVQQSHRAREAIIRRSH